MATTSATLKQKVYRGIKEYILITFYLWLGFRAVRYLQIVLASQYHIDLAAKSIAFINALLLAKIALIARQMKLDERLCSEGRPLICVTLLNAAAFVADDILQDC